MSETIRPGLMRRLQKEVGGEVLFDRFSRGRYATDASIYQMMPAGVVVAKRSEDVAAALAAARDEGVALTMRGGGTSQCGQTVNSGLIVDTSKHLNRLLELDVEGRRASVEPGIVLDDLNRLLKPHGLWFPVDVSTASRATIGGMAGNNSSGSRSLRYGTMRDNVVAIDALLADGTAGRFAELGQDASNEPPRDLVAAMLALGRRGGGRNRSAFSDPAAPRRRLQSRRVGAGRTARASGRSISPISSSARKARSQSRPRSRSSCRRCRSHESCSASAIFRRSARQWRPPGTSSI